MRDHGRMDAAQELTQRMVDSVRRLVEVESPSADPLACARAVATAALLTEEWLGSPAQVLDHGGRAALRWGPERPRVLLLGHLDTVWPLGTLERLPWRVEGDALRGPGVFDMKAGVVQGLAALHLLGEAGRTGAGLLLTTDEEIGSGTSRDLIESTAGGADAVLVLEPSVDADLKSARKGTSWYVVEFRGRAAHAGLEPEKGVNALLEAAALVSACTGWADPGLGTTVTPTTARAGTTDNTVPDTAVVGIDARAWSADEQRRVDAAMRGWSPLHPEATIEIVAGGINRPAMPESASAGLLALARECARDLGLPEPGAQAVGGGSDGNFTAALGVATLDGLGAVGAGAHADHEWASVTGMVERSALVAALVSRILAGVR